MILNITIYKRLSIAFLLCFISLFPGKSQCWEANLELPDTIGIFDVYFANDTIGWITGTSGEGDPNIMAKTIDGGNNWTFIYYPDPLFQNNELGNCCKILHFIDDQIGYAVFATNGFHKTIDGGDSWQQIEWGEELPSHHEITAIDFISPDTGWIAVHQVGIFSTTDGGENWAPQDTESNIKSIDFINENEGWYVTTGGNSYGALYHTIDGGQNWELELFIWDTYFTNVQFINASVGWVAGMSDLIYKTTDGGENWNPINNPTGEPFFIKDMMFVNDTMGWICSQFDNKIQFTQDGGTSWKLQSTPDAGRFRSMFMTATDKGWAVTDDGFLLEYNPRPACNEAQAIYIDYSFGEEGWLTPLMPEIYWTPILGCIDGYLLQLGAIGDPIAYLEVDVGMETSYQLTSPLPPDTTRIKVRVVPYNNIYGPNPDCSSYGSDFFTTSCPPLPAPIDTFICEGEAFYWDGNVFEEPGVYQIPYLTTMDCDSTITLNLQWYEPPMQTIIDTAVVAGQPFDGIYYDNDTIFTEFLPAISGCDSIVIYIINIVTDINNPDEGLSWDIFPNPAAVELFVTGRHGWEEIICMDIHGRIIRRWTDNNQPGRKKYDISNLDNGLYFFQIRSGERLWTQKIFVSK